MEGTSDEWTTGTWTLGQDTIQSLIGGNVCLHTAQKAPCYLGGKILACEVADDGKYTIRFRFDKDLVNTTTDDYCKDNWSVGKLLERVA